MIVFPASIGMVGPASSGGGSTYFSEVSADSPLFWWRHAEASGTTMEEEGGADGSYNNSPALGQSALYSGGPTCVAVGPGNACGIYTNAIPALNQLTVECIAEFNALTGQQWLICNDDGSARHYQWCANGSSLQFVKIAGGVSVETASGVLSSGPHHYALTVSSTGVAIMYIDGSAVYTSSALGAADYGTSGQITIGFCAGGGGAQSTNLKISESAIYNSVLSPTRIAVHAAAAGV